jgi:hypothetical protein
LAIGSSIANRRPARGSTFGDVTWEDFTTATTPLPPGETSNILRYFHTKIRDVVLR